MTLEKAIGIIFMILLGIGLIAGVIIYGVYLNYQYERVIGSHMDNARDMNTPSRMKEELLLAKQGMIDEGLKPENYGALIFKKPDNSMKFQYEHLDSIIERVDAVTQWKEEINQAGGNAETLGDVYEQKMDNLRDFIYEGTRSDWIAKDAWYIKNHKLYYIFTDILLIPLVIVVFIIITTIGIILSQ